jgi:hypothetical protein
LCGDIERLQLNAVICWLSNASIARTTGGCRWDRPRKLSFFTWAVWCDDESPSIFFRLPETVSTIQTDPLARWPWLDPSARSSINISIRNRFLISDGISQPPFGWYPDG